MIHTSGNWAAILYPWAHIPNIIVEWEIALYMFSPNLCTMDDVVVVQLFLLLVRLLACCCALFPIVPERAGEWCTPNQPTEHDLVIRNQSSQLKEVEYCITIWSYPHISSPNAIIWIVVFASNRFLKTLFLVFKLLLINHSSLVNYWIGFLVLELGYGPEGCYVYLNYLFNQSSNLKSP